jgi:hypothetical protein
MTGDSASPTVDEFLGRSATVIAGFDFPEPEFLFTIGLADSHLELLEGRFAERGTPDLLTESAWRHGRVLLHGEGGVGKSTVVRRLMSAVSRDGGFAAVVDLRDWTPGLLEEWDELRGDPAARAELLLGCLSAPVFSEEDLGTLGPDRAALLVLDGLNETPGPTANSILEVADAIAVRNPQAGVLVTDRLLRRTLPSRHWQLAGVVDVTPPEGHPAVHHPLARGNAFFLSLALKEGMDAVPGTAVLDEFMSRHVELDSAELASASTAAADAYIAASSRIFALHRFVAVAGEPVVDKLVAAGVLRADTEQAIFRHHLFHDDLAARWLADGDSDRWVADNFAALTFDANSFDVLALALARIDDPDHADRFVLSVYDYNYYGTAYALAEGARLGTTAVSDDTRFAVVSMLAERRFDQMRPTVDQVEDALRLFDDSTTVALRRVLTLSDLLELVGNREVHDPHISLWQSLFVVAPGSTASSQAVEALTGDDPLLGWTAANVLRRTEMNDEQLQAVWAALRDDERSVVRWRAAHALGSQPEPDSVVRLLGGTEDANPLVRYGAVRSLVDLAAGHESLRGTVLSALKEEAERLVADPKPATELERSLQRVDATSEWIKAITPLVEELWAKAPSIERREHWRVVARKIEHSASLSST